MLQQSHAIPNGGDEHSHGTKLLGPILCWAVVFADIGTSVYYVPGILYGTVGRLAGFFVSLTMIAFVLLVLKYVEVTHRFPQGGGVVTVAAEALGKWWGALGGMFILVDYFLTAAISSLSAIQYLAVIYPVLTPTVVQLIVTILTLSLLGVLNWFGITESARVSLFAAILAFGSDVAILITVFSHISFWQFLDLFSQMFAGGIPNPKDLLTGFAGSFLAFSGLESISQLSPEMKVPRKKIAAIAMVLVVLTIGVTSPLLTMLSTMLQQSASKDPVLSTQLISLLGGHWGNVFLQVEVAISASALLVFASNTAIIGAYHVFMALSRMEFLPGFVLKRNKMRNTPHVSIILAVIIPIGILIAVKGAIDVLGDMYAFGLMGAFTLTCIGLDVIRNHERKAAQKSLQTGLTEAGLVVTKQTLARWNTVLFYAGLFTTVIIIVAWVTNLINKPLATEFGVASVVLGMCIALVNRYIVTKEKGAALPILATQINPRLKHSVFAVLTNGNNDAVIHSSVESAYSMNLPIVFTYYSPVVGEKYEFMGIQDSYHNNDQAKEAHRQAYRVAREKDLDQHHIYNVLRGSLPEALDLDWQVIQPRDTVVPKDHPEFENLRDVSPDRVRYSGGAVHLLRRW